MTPAQASGQPDFVTDWPIQGPTDPGMRAADCWFAQNRIPTPQNAACVDCKGPIPMTSLASNRSSGLSEQISFGGKGALGFALESAGDPEIWSNLKADQQAWVLSTLTQLNALIQKSNPGSMCPGWVTPSGASGITGATGCFQMWFNSVYPPGTTVRQLRTDGVFDQDTLDGIKTITQIHASDFPTPFPGTVAKAGLSTGAMVGIAAAGAAAVGGVIYVASHGGKRRGKRK